MLLPKDLLALIASTNAATILPFLALIHFASLARAECECGYRIPESNELYTHALVTDFTETTTVTSVAGIRRVLKDWTVQSWMVPGTEGRDESLAVKDSPARAVEGGSFNLSDSRLPRINMEQNVWLQDGTLRLKQKAYSQMDYELKLPVQIAEVTAEKYPLLYGSFRADYRLVVPEQTEGGTCVGFFYYHDDNSEVDIEIITNDKADVLHYTKHLVQNGTDLYSSSKHPLSTPYSSFTEHRFDWSPSTLTFYQNGQRSKSISGPTPSKPGRIHFNIWADDGDWTGRPANKDIEVHIRYIALYYNTTASHMGKDLEFERKCFEARNSTDRVCVLARDIDELKYNVTKIAGSGRVVAGSTRVMVFAVFAVVLLELL